jgi:hypothetical protein
MIAAAITITPATTTIVATIAATDLRDRRRDRAQVGRVHLDHPLDLEEVRAGFLGAHPVGEDPLRMLVVPHQGLFDTHALQARVKVV